MLGLPQMRTLAAIVLLASYCALFDARVASAAEVTRVLSARSVKDFDFDFSLAYLHDNGRGLVKREAVDATSVLVVNDLLYRQIRDSLLLRTDVGLVHDVSLFVAGSFVVADSRGLDFDRVDDCVADGCVETLLRDGFLPGEQSTRWGLDAETGRPFQAPSTQVFAGPKRSGLEYLAFGARWAPFNQARDHTKPTWMVGLETHLSVGEDQRFDPGKPTANRGVGPGYHQFILSMAFSRKFADHEPFVSAWYMEPALTKSSVFKNQGEGEYASVQRRTGGQAGIESEVWGNPTLGSRLVLQASGHLEYRFAGLAHSELWEVLSGDSRCGPTATAYCRPGIDVNRKGESAPNSGISRSPGYGLAGFDVGFSAQASRYARLRGLLGMLFVESHLLTDGASGNQVYDIPGRRFRVEASYSWHVLVDAMATF
jgi:hypothetical protein